jgi:3-phenylpropionate/trans-cinnamate dioxygenase ferredoxin component
MQSQNESLACLCEENEIEEGRSKKFVVNGREILLLKTNGSLQAIESFCPHAFADFSLGKINARAGTIKCTNHGAVFDLKNGKALCGPFGVDGGNPSFTHVLQHSNCRWQSVSDLRGILALR